MPLSVIGCDPGGEYLIPWARKKLNFWHQQMVASGRWSLFKIVQVSDGSVVYASSLMAAPGVFLDKIRITTSPGWDFFVYKRDTGTTDGAGNSDLVYLFTLGKAAPRTVTLDRNVDEGTSSFERGAVRSLNKRFIGFFDTANGWKTVSPAGKVGAASVTSLIAYSDTTASRIAVGETKCGGVVLAPSDGGGGG